MRNNRIVIIGDGVAAWLCASACARALNKVVASIHVVPISDTGSGPTDHSLGISLNAEASSPAMVEFNRMLGYNEHRLIHSSRGGFTLGKAISEWAPGQTVFNPFGEVGSPLGPVSFQHLIYRLRDAGQTVKFANYSLAALCAQSLRFATTSAADRSVLSSLEYGMHIDVVAYAQALKADAVAHGVGQSATAYERAVLNNSGWIDAVVTTSGEHVDGDVFVDCSGASRKLYSVINEYSFNDWSAWLPSNRITNVVVPTDASPQPYTHLVAQAAGWARVISLPGRRCESTCFQGQNCTDNQADVFTPGYYASPWQKNCVALGGAATVIDPASSLSLHLLCSSVKRLINLFPSSRYGDQESIEFNRQAVAEVEAARDYAIAHYKLNGRVGEPFWDACRHMAVPDSLSHRIQVYKHCGRVVLHDGEVVDRMNWIALFDAQSIYPEQYDVVARGVPLPLINEHLASIRQTLLGAVATLPTYQYYLSQTSP